MNEGPSSGGGFSVAAARPHEERAARMLLPDAFAGAVWPRLLIATSGSPARVVGAAAIIPRPRGRVTGFVAMVRVAEPFRRRGIARALVEAAAVEAKARGMKALHAPKPVEPGGVEEQCWAALGFKSRVEVKHYQTEVDRMIEVLAPLWDRVAARGRMPAEARLVGLHESSAEAVASLHVSQLGGEVRSILRRIKGGVPESFEPGVSYALHLGGRLAGVVLAHIVEPGVVFCDAVIVVPELRGTWPQLLLKLHSARQAREMGLKVIRFTAHDEHADTHRMAAKLGAGLVKTMVVPYREI